MTAKVMDIYATGLGITVVKKGVAETVFLTLMVLCGYSKIVTLSMVFNV
jgi:hypothetical protein